MWEESKERGRKRRNVGRVLVNREVSGRWRVAREAGEVLWDRTEEREI
jgi:hypothetical protein